MLHEDAIRRMPLVKQFLFSAASASWAFCSPSPAMAVGLTERLAARDSSKLIKPILNMPPGRTLYPEWLNGEWRASIAFDGYELPPCGISREELFSQPTIPGFQKLSVASIPDVGSSWSCRLRYVKPDPTQKAVFEDRAYNLRSITNGCLGYDAIDRVEYEPTSLEYNKGPNRISLVFKQGRTPNAERIELFANSREWETLAGADIFVCSESIRQVTFGASKVAGVARQVSTEYAHYFTFRRFNDQEVPAFFVCLARTS
uniref:DUF6816 domain-containing protein n=1 Tax=Chrysotila carterae TaxID=13221 RepID=A0A7S4EWY0_CHRCT|mmetsp:Transcript_43233/g.94637  ORF Transcript_43233/g.94637 Transcript_43233/m.94637 type:complete len:259 (+) Transcript_43233:166-942(+)